MPFGTKNLISDRHITAALVTSCLRGLGYGEQVSGRLRCRKRLRAGYLRQQPLTASFSLTRVLEVDSYHTLVVPFKKASEHADSHNFIADDTWTPDILHNFVGLQPFP